MKILFYLFFFLILVLESESQVVLWKKQMTSFVNDFDFTKDGKSIIVKHSDKAILLDIKDNSITKEFGYFDQYSNDLKFALTRKADSLIIYDLENNIIYSSLNFPRKKDTSFRFVLAPGNKYFLKISSIGFSDSINSYENAFVDILDMKTGKFIKRVLGFENDTIGIIHQTIFDKIKDKVYLSGKFSLKDSISEYQLQTVKSVDFSDDNFLVLTYSEKRNDYLYNGFLPLKPTDSPDKIIIEDPTVLYISFNVIEKNGSYSKTDDYSFEEGHGVCDYAFKNGFIIIYQDIGDKYINIVSTSGGPYGYIEYTKATKIYSFKDSTYPRIHLRTLPNSNSFAVSIRDTIILFGDPINGIDENSKNLGLILSPNPATDFLEISLSQPSEGWQPSEGYHIAIYNVFGTKIPPRLTSSATPQEGNLRLDVSGLSPGVYFVKVGEKVGKFVKM